MDVKNLRTLVTNETNKLFIANLGRGTEYIRMLHDSFLEGFRWKECTISSFYETKDTAEVVVIGPAFIWTNTHSNIVFLQMRADGEWDTCTDEKSRIRLVTRESATMVLKTEKNHQQLPINEDHYGMVKFNLGSPDYARVRGRLLNAINQAPGILERRKCEIDHRNRT